MSVTRVKTVSCWFPTSLSNSYEVKLAIRFASSSFVALSAETARLDFGTFGTRFCYIGTWNIESHFKSIDCFEFCGAVVSLSLSLSPGFV